MEKKKMTCQCGTEMNHHADKLDYTKALEEPKKADPKLGGVLEEVHTCPECHTTEMREANA